MDILDNYFMFVKVTKQLNDDEKYKVFQFICKFQKPCILFIYLCISYLNDDNNQLSMKIFNFSVRYMLLFFLATYIDFLIMIYV